MGKQNGKGLPAQREGTNRTEGGLPAQREGANRTKKASLLSGNGQTGREIASLLSGNWQTEPKMASLLSGNGQTGRKRRLPRVLAGNRLPNPAPGARALRLGVVPEVPVPIVLAALGPGSIRLAGELADAWTPFLWARSRVGDGRALLREGELRAETPTPTGVSLGIPVGAGARRGERAATRGLVAVDVPDAHGPAVPAHAGRALRHERRRRRDRRGRRRQGATRAAGGRRGTRLDVTLFGTYDEAADTIAAWFSAGADSINLVMPPGHPEEELQELLDVAHAASAAPREALAPARPARLPAELALGLGVRGARLDVHVAPPSCRPPAARPDRDPQRPLGADRLARRPAASRAWRRARRRRRCRRPGAPRSTAATVAAAASSTWMNENSPCRLPITGKRRLRTSLRGAAVLARSRCPGRRTSRSAARSPRARRRRAPRAPSRRSPARPRRRARGASGMSGASSSLTSGAGRARRQRRCSGRRSGARRRPARPAIRLRVPSPRRRLVAS